MRRDPDTSGVTLAGGSFRRGGPLRLELELTGEARCARDTYAPTRSRPRTGGSAFAG